jgi:hypothetical protein
MRWPWQRRTTAPAVPAVPVPRASWAQAALPPVEASRQVTLGFTDGSEVALPEHDPRAVALRAVADVLVQPTPRE